MRLRRALAFTMPLVPFILVSAAGALILGEGYYYIVALILGLAFTASVVLMRKS